MSKTVIWSVSIDSPRYFVRSIIQEKAMKPVGISLTLLGVDSAWDGEVTEDRIKDLAKNANIETSEFMRTTLKALTGAEPKSFGFDLKTNGDQSTFSWKKLVQSKSNAAGLSFTLGSIQLKTLSEKKTGERFFEILAYIQEKNEDLTKSKEYFEEQNSRLSEERKEAIQKLEEAAEAKEQFESEIFERFAVLLNSKKRKNQELINENEELRSNRGIGMNDIIKETCSDQGEESRSPSPSTSKKLENRRISNGEDTDEEKEKTAEIRKEKSFAKQIKIRATGISGSTPDEEDVFVPKRNRKRGRGQKNQEEAEEKTEEVPETRRTRSGRSSGGSSIGNSSSLIGQLS